MSVREETNGRKTEKLHLMALDFVFRLKTIIATRNEFRNTSFCSQAVQRIIYNKNLQKLLTTKKDLHSCHYIQ